MTYTDVEIRHLAVAEARRELLTELLAMPHDARSRAAAGGRHRRTLEVVLASVAAAAVAAVGVTSVVSNLDPPEGSQRFGRPADAGGSRFSATLVSMAERSPRILLDAPGWRIDTVYGFGNTEGTLGFRKGDAALELDWYRARSYDDYFHDREYDSSVGHRDTRLFGQTARLFTYGATDHATMTKPEGRSFVEIRGQNMNRKAYLDLTAQLRQVGVREFLQAMPTNVVVPGRAGAAARKLLVDIPLPPGFALKPTDAVDDAYQFGAAVTGQVFCAWSRYYRAGDRAARRKAVDALESSHHWKVLHVMNAEGDYPEVMWEYADRFAAGRPVPQHEVEQGLGCHE